MKHSKDRLYIFRITYVRGGLLQILVVNENHKNLHNIMILVTSNYCNLTDVTSNTLKPN